MIKCKFCKTTLNGGSLKIMLQFCCIAHAVRNYLIDCMEFTPFEATNSLAKLITIAQLDDEKAIEKQMIQFYKEGGFING